ncbi:hypothetical protein AS19_26460 [Alcanivorax sp. NBRC 101098]|uniref:hypothetical protein n=1 Tax=Alcanivorax sp. NBRC 101098 TaxID=1113728 RepID=UPI0004ABED35|nr:hypothetical protein [Alcanivorax sp. NBRC 101098]BAP15497.1 hypothetical protein AS19_26460 [Alcanivorax sp. NBRC 101098]
MKKDVIKQNAQSLTQRLDHMVPDPKISAAENQKAAAELAALSGKLFGHVPDQSLSPLERLERLARGIDERKPNKKQLEPAVKKLQELKQRIDELVDGDLSHEKKIDVILEKLDEKVGSSQKALHTTDKLELLGDPRGNVAPEVKKISKKKPKK